VVSPPSAGSRDLGSAVYASETTRCDVLALLPAVASGAVATNKTSGRPVVPRRRAVRLLCERGVAASDACDATSWRSTSTPWATECLLRVRRDDLSYLDATGSSTRARTWPLHRRGDGWRRFAWGSLSYVERESTCLSRAGEEVVPDPEEAIVQMMKLVIAVVDAQVLQAHLHGEMELITARLPLVDAILPRDRASSLKGIGNLLRCHLCFSSPCNPMNKELCRLFRMYNL
jgi:hypothetical protein